MAGRPAPGQCVTRLAGGFMDAFIVLGLIWLSGVLVGWVIGRSEPRKPMTDLASLEARLNEQAAVIDALKLSNKGIVLAVDKHSANFHDLDARLVVVERGMVPPVPSAWAKFWTKFKSIAGPVVKLFAPGAASAAAIVGVCLYLGVLTAPGCHPGPVPVPPIPVPPIPVPPVPPIPPLPPAPIPMAGFRVFVMYDKDALTKEQEGIVFGRVPVRDYIDAKCVKGDDGTPDRRIYAAGTDTTGAPQWARDVIQRHPGQRAYMVVSDGKTGYDGPIPANADEAMKILTKIGN